MFIPPIPKEIKKQFVDYLKQNQKMTVGIIYLGESHGGYVFRRKRPKWTKNMILGMPAYLFVKNDILTGEVGRNEDLYNDFLALDASVNEDECYMITKDDEE